jgi:hypothetical protein
MRTSHKTFLTWLSLASLAVPLVAYVMCSEVSTSHLFFHAPPWGRNVGLLIHYSFLVSAIIGVIILLGDVGFRRWWLALLPLLSLIFTYLLYIQAAWFFARFLD